MSLTRTSYWFAIGLLLCSFTTLTAQDEFEKQLKQAQLAIYQNPQEAVERSLSIYEQATELEIKIATLIVLVNGFTALNNNETAMQYALKAQVMAEESGNIHFQIRTLGLLGEQYQLYHLNSISREYLKKAEDLLSSPGLTREEVVVTRGNIYAVKGNSYKDQIDCTYAIENYNFAIAEYKKVPEHTGAQNNLALVYLEKGNCLLELGDLETAKLNFNNAKTIASANALLEYSNYAELGLAKIETEEENFNSAIARLLSLRENKQLSTQVSIELQVFALLKENYKQIQDFESYLDMQRKYAESLAEIEGAEDTNFQQVLSFINNIYFEEKSDSAIRKLIIYLFGGVLILAILYETSFQIRRRKQVK